MGKQILFCVETNPKSNTDWIYITEVIKFYFDRPNDMSLKPVYMGTKSKYNSKKVLDDIAKKTKAFSGETTVVYCIDTDDIYSNPKDMKDFENIRNYCNENGHKLIWFFNEIEEVFWGEHISDSIKVKKAAEFKRKNLVSKINLNNLSQTNALSCNTSNIYNVLKELLEIKD